MKDLYPAQRIFKGMDDCTVRRRRTKCANQEKAAVSAWKRLGSYDSCLPITAPTGPLNACSRLEI